MRHAAAGASFSSSHSVGISKPARCAARRIASPGIAVTSFPSIQIVQVGCPEGISPMCDTVGSCDSAGCVYRSSKLIRRPPCRPARACAAGPVPGASPPALAHPPRPLAYGPLALVQADGSPWGPRIARTDWLRCHPLRGCASSWLDHSFVPAAPHGLARSLRTSLLLDVNLVVVGELSHCRSENRRSSNPEAAQREALHVRPQFVQPREIGFPSQSGVRALENCLHALRPDTAGDADGTALLGQVR